MEIIMYEGEEILSAKYDHVFKALFTGEDRTLLASFLSSVLETRIGAGDVTILNAEPPSENRKDKRPRLDVRARLADGSDINIEMQAADKGNMGKRSLYNLSRLMSGQLRSGGDTDYGGLCPTIAINVLDFDYLKEQGKYVSRYRMREAENGIEMRDGKYFEIIFIELPKLPKDAGDSMIELWVKFFSAKTEEDLKMLAAKNPVFGTAVKRLREFSADDIERYWADMELKAELDRNTDIAEAKQKGVVESLTKVVKAMRANGFDNSSIAEMIDCPVAEIERL